MTANPRKQFVDLDGGVLAATVVRKDFGFYWFWIAYPSEWQPWGVGIGEFCMFHCSASVFVSVETNYSHAITI